jgi:predicted nucleotidyltransferase
MENLHIVCKALGGSHSYGLNTPSSDTDWRGIFMHTDIHAVIGLGRFEHQQDKEGGKDEEMKEFRHALTLLRQANSQMVELLFIEDWAEISPLWSYTIQHRKKLISSEKLFSCLRGYMQGELRLANGERTGKLGGKRKEALDLFGFSPKNMVQLMRLAWAGTIYFSRGYFPVQIAKEDSILAGLLLDIKTCPQKFSKNQLNDMAHQWEEALARSFENRKVDTQFDIAFANELCLRAYGPLVCERYNQLPSAILIKSFSGELFH